MILENVVVRPCLQALNRGLFVDGAGHKNKRSEGNKLFCNKESSHAVEGGE